MTNKPKIRTAKYTKWLVSLHEAAHLVAFDKMSHSLHPPELRAVLFDKGIRSGVAKPPRDLTEHGYAVGVAAGMYGERLIDYYPRPRSHTKKNQIVKAQQIEIEKGNAKSAAKMRDEFPIGKITTDAERVAAHCIKFSPGDPKDWTRRFKRVHAHARYLTWKHRDQVRAVATVLYYTGAYFRAARKNHF